MKALKRRREGRESHGRADGRSIFVVVVVVEVERWRKVYRRRCCLECAGLAGACSIGVMGLIVVW